MTIKQDNHRYQITMTPEEQMQLQSLCETTGERPSTLIRRLIAAEAALTKAGFLPTAKSLKKKVKSC
ncbi:hypothetical protein [Lacticaseibacillus paracasei]|uniref:hypothetical protein n=1 Tax=Lacticaseibacillus paracasei TaxID=1597 RepID=UPI0034E8CF46